jgi:type VI protein secretion system component Hcp
MSKNMSRNIESVKPVELTADELDLVSAGELSLEFSAIQWTYVQQRSEGSEPAPKPGH